MDIQINRMAIGCLQFAMSEVVLDEIAALSAIYCDKDEFEEIGRAHV